MNQIRITNISPLRVYLASSSFSSSSLNPRTTMMTRPLFIPSPFWPRFIFSVSLKTGQKRRKCIHSGGFFCCWGSLMSCLRTSLCCCSSRWCNCRCCRRRVYDHSFILFYLLSNRPKTSQFRTCLLWLWGHLLQFSLPPPLSFLFLLLRLHSFIFISWQCQRWFFSILEIDKLSLSLSPNSFISTRKTI